MWSRVLLICCVFAVKAVASFPIVYVIVGVVVGVAALICIIVILLICIMFW